jgi:hypothetical protein
VKQVGLKGLASDERKKAMLSALEREIDLLKTLQHENIVQYLGELEITPTGLSRPLTLPHRFVHRRRQSEHLP